MSKRPTPTYLKIVRGNPGKRPINRAEPPAPPAIPEPPAWLCAAALVEWERHAPRFKDSGILSHLDRDAFANYCQALGRLAEAEGELAKSGLTYTTPSGFVRPSPWLKIIHETVNVITRLQVEFGLTPSARSRIKVESKEIDEFDRYLQGGPRRVT